jgi:hypothetical protein
MIPNIMSGVTGNPQPPYGSILTRRGSNWPRFESGSTGSTKTRSRSRSTSSFVSAHVSLSYSSPVSAGTLPPPVRAPSRFASASASAIRLSRTALALS